MSPQGILAADRAALPRRPNCRRTINFAEGDEENEAALTDLKRDLGDKVSSTNKMATLK